MPGKDKADSLKCRREQTLRKADDTLAEIDKVLGENTWDEPRRIRRSGGKRLGTTQRPGSRLGS